MKRSEINAVIRRFEAMLAEHCFELPPFLKFTPEEWETKGHEYDEIRDNQLGWDVTDYGMGDYAHLGLALITLRNGNVHNDKYTKCYAEKIIMCDEGQVSPHALPLEQDGGYHQPGRRQHRVQALQRHRG